MTAALMELLKIAIVMTLDYVREGKMTDEQIVAYKKQVDDVFMKLPSATTLPDV